MKVQCHRVKLKAGSIAKVREWASKLNQEMGEVKETLKREGVVLESVFLENTEDGQYLIYYMRSDDLNKAREIAKKNPLPIDVYHASVMKEVTDDGTQLECLLDASLE